MCDCVYAVMVLLDVTFVACERAQQFETMRLPREIIRSAMRASVGCVSTPIIESVKMNKSIILLVALLGKWGSMGFACS